MTPTSNFKNNRIAEVLALISQGENSSVEFKSANAHPDSLAKEMVAFANTQGGALLIGVEDDGRISGLTDSVDHEARIANIACNNINPPITIESAIVAMPEGRVLLVKVGKAGIAPIKPCKTSF